MMAVCLCGLSGCGGCARCARFMCAGCRIDAGIVQHQPLHRTAFDQMRLHNFRDILCQNASVPDALWIHDHRRPVFTLIQASRLVYAHRGLESRRVCGLFQQSVQLRFALWITAATSASRLPLVGANKYMSLKLCHFFALRKILSTFILK